MTTVAETTYPTETEHVVSGEFTTTRAEFVDALATVSASIVPRSAVPFLTGVLLESHGTDLVLTTSDYDASITVRIPDAVRVPGRLLVSHAELTKLLSAMVKGVRKRDADRASVTVRAQDNDCATVELAGSTIPMELWPIEDYPELPAKPGTVAYAEAEQFATETRRVLRAVGKDDTLPLLTGMKIDISDHGLTLVATDRYRLAVGYVHAGIVTDTVPENGVLIDGALLGKVLPKLRGDDIRLGYGTSPFGDLVSLESGHVTVVARLHNDGEFVRYADHLPNDSEGTVVVDRSELLTQTQRSAAVLAAKMSKHQYTPVSVTVSAGAVRVAPSLDEGAKHVRTPALSARTSGIRDITLGLNHQFLTDALESFTGDTVTLHLRAPTKPVLLTDTPDGLRDATAFRHMLMPVRLSS